MDVNEMINKSLEDIDNLATVFEKSAKVEEEDDTVSKARDTEEQDLAGRDISDDAPDLEEEDEQEREEQATEGTEGTESTDGAEENEEEEDVDVDEDYEKSLEKELSSNESAKKALEVSDFLQEMVKSIDTTIANTRTELSKSIKEEVDGSNMYLAKSVQGIAKSQQLIAKAIADNQAEFAKSIKALNERIEEVSRQPVVRKSVATNATPVNKSFDASVGQPQQQNNTLSKSQATSKLMGAYEQGNQGLADDIMAFESTGDFNVLSEDAKNILGIQ